MTHPTTNTEISTYQTCPVKHALRYVHGLAPIGKSFSLSLGSHFHNILEQYYSGKEIAFAHEDFQTQTICEELFKKLKAEPPLDIVEVEGVWEKDGWAGRSDGIVKLNGKYAILEHKTTTRTDPGYTDAIWHSQQLHIYCHVLGIEHVLYQVFQYSKLSPKIGETDSEFEIRKSELKCPARGKRKSAEGIEAYRARLSKKMSIVRYEMFISKEQSAKVFKEMMLWRDKMKADDPNKRAPNYNNCNPVNSYRCPYYSACHSNFAPYIMEAEYEVRPVNEELL